ncbi:ABC transporter ATP-binding protein [Desulfolucanica intricata]|uniref:ABC transporter ATP-binding protein n=1 Tax=Desulfolucanica intricata TaxID=1285191 RepID=UPI0009EE6E21|nr:ABC transporter ATP-binding protein [Desulfolucanica intricata]
MNKIIIEVKNLALEKGKNKILDIDYFALNQHENIALIGPNGAGKSTFLQVLMLLQRPTSGELFYKGDKINWKKPIGYRRRMAMVFQEPLLLDTTVYHNVASGLKIRRLKKEEIQARIKKWLQKLGIIHLSDRSIRYLSGGEAQRVSLARALVMDPEVLFLDEPFSALDAPTRTALVSDLAAILRDTRISSVFVTHNYSEVPLLTDRVVALEEGRIVQTASPQEILNRPNNITVASLVGVENIIPGRIIAGDGEKVLVQAGPHTITASKNTFSAGESVHVLLRPENIKITSESGNNNGNLLGGIIINILPHGGLFKAIVDCGFPLVTIQNPGQVLGGELNIGKKVFLSFNPDKVHLIDRKD